MCTVTFIARQQGYCLGMNRDEKLTRPIGRPPQARRVNGRIVLCPSEPRGGTWIATNDAAATFALINWYSIPARVESTAVSRGAVVDRASVTNLPEAAQAALGGLPLNRINPFRLIGVFPKPREIVEWRWDLQQLVRKNLRWQTQQWISSGFDEPTAQRERSATFCQAQQQSSAGGLDWLRRLHQSHSPHAGPFSICMHRADAATVSYTEVSVVARNATMRHFVGTPCQTQRTPHFHVVDTEINNAAGIFSPRKRSLPRDVFGK